MTKLPHELRPWAVADASLERAKWMLDRVDQLLEHERAHKVLDPIEMGLSPDRERAILVKCAPFFWGADPVDAVLAASADVPLDTELAFWNLPIEGAWWHLEKWLPLAPSMPAAEFGVSAISMAWKRDPDTKLPTCCLTMWIEDERTKDRLGFTPSQGFAWRQGETIAVMLERIAREHGEVYGPTGPFSLVPQTPLDIFVHCAKVLAQFMLAAFAWLEQKVVLEDRTEPAERHSRKRHEQKTGKPHPGVRVIQLRRAERKETGEQSDPTGRHVTVRFVVRGHWRQQPCGPNRERRRLTWVHAHVKGPDGAPFQERKEAFEAIR